MRLRLQTKMPDIKKGLELVTLLCDKQVRVLSTASPPHAFRSCFARARAAVGVSPPLRSRAPSLDAGHG
jgi:hypothetical protein